jgi:hypothetical protein
MGLFGAGRQPIVDELDDEEFRIGGRAGGFGMPLDFMGGDNRIIEMLRDEHDILNRMMAADGFIPPHRIIADPGRWGMPPGRAHRDRNDIDPALENGHYL